MRSLEQDHQRLVEFYFNDPARQITLSVGEVLCEQDNYNDRLYYVLEGRLSGTIGIESTNFDSDDDDFSYEQSDERVTMFDAKAGMFIGMHSYFSCDKRSSCRVTALQPSKLAWIEQDTQAIESECFGSLNEQFMRVIIEELFRRQMRLRKMATEREQAIKRLFDAERLSTLGQLAAGISHELNNAVGVVNSCIGRIVQFLSTQLDKKEPELSPWFERGLTEGQQVSSAEVRQRIDTLQSELKITAIDAKRLARIYSPAEVTTLPQDLHRALQLWEVGRDCYDMQLAIRHAADIVRSVKQVGGSDVTRQSEIDINQTIHEALTLLKSRIRGITIDLQLSELSAIIGNNTEFVQVWLNIIENACDAMRDGQTENPKITVYTHLSKRSIRIGIENNGPPLAEGLAARIFEPNFTTKNAGHSIGLGLGLYIVKRMISSYGGRVRVESNPERTRFYVVLPLSLRPTNGEEING